MDLEVGRAGGERGLERADARTDVVDRDDQRGRAELAGEVERVTAADLEAAVVSQTAAERVRGRGLLDGGGHAASHTVM